MTFGGGTAVREEFSFAEPSLSRNGDCVVAVRMEVWSRGADPGWYAS
jgi:hypothetical protein